MKTIAVKILNSLLPLFIKKKLLGVWLKNNEFRLFCKRKIIDPDDLFLNRFLWSDLKQTLNVINNRFKDGFSVIILTDRLDVPAGIKIPVIHVNNFDLQKINPSVIVICAFNSDEKLANTLKILSSVPGIHYYNPFRVLPTARYFHRNDLAWETLIEEYKSNHGKFDLADFENIIQALDITANIEGDYVEIGVYRGDSAHLALNYMKRKRLERNCYFFDLFEGFTNNTSAQSGDSVWVNSHKDTSFESVKFYLNDFPNSIILKLDIIENELPELIQKIAVCNIDVDIYEATSAALLKVAPHVVNGGIIIVEDQGHTPLLAGAYLAVHEFINSSASSNFIPVHLDSGQIYFIRI
jgi:hypothetical protein